MEILVSAKNGQRILGWGLKHEPEKVRLVQRDWRASVEVKKMWDGMHARAM